MKADRKRLKGEKTDLVSQMQQLYATLESREEQLRDFIRNYEQHRKESEDAVKALAKEKDLLEREKWELRRQAKEATDHATALRSQLDLKDNRMKELEAELAMVRPPSPPCLRPPGAAAASSGSDVLGDRGMTLVHPTVLEWSGVQSGRAGPQSGRDRGQGL
ncbi:kazrin-like [Pteropus vampyrus]|uniref:Kazrin-like n=1 Tax=Pteropus vampyrus TaxID=132908 RepID=A0A6P3S3U9_PTEVA|nr:kazrin-like [Pteropus vampyrus]